MHYQSRDLIFAAVLVAVITVTAIVAYFLLSFGSHHITILRRRTSATTIRSEGKIRSNDFCLLQRRQKSQPSAIVVVSVGVVVAAGALGRESDDDREEESSSTTPKRTFKL